MNKALYTRWVAPLLAEAEQVADTLKEFGVEYVGAVKLSWIGPTPLPGILDSMIDDLKALEKSP